MSGIIRSSLENLKHFLQDYHISFTNGLLILFTIGGEQIFKSTAFDCPCTQPMAKIYACVLLFIPPVILALVGVAASNLTWRLCHGCCSRDKINSNGCCNTCMHFGIVVSRALIVPLTWLFITGLDGSYYACMLSDRAINCKSETVIALNETEEALPGTEEAFPETEEQKYMRIKKDAQMYSWCALLGLVVVSITVICIVRCLDSVTIERFQFIEHYRDAEEKAFNAAQEEYANNLAKKAVKIFMESEPREKEDWDYISRIPAIRLNGCAKSSKPDEAAKQNEQETAAKPDKAAKPDEQDAGAKPDKAAKPDEAAKTDEKNKTAFFTYLHKWASEYVKTVPAGAGTSTTEVKTLSNLSATGVQNIVRPRPTPPQRRNETPIPLLSTFTWDKGATEKISKQ